jgi:hypothetical protein
MSLRSAFALAMLVALSSCGSPFESRDATPHPDASDDVGLRDARSDRELDAGSDAPSDAGLDQKTETGGDVVAVLDGGRDELTPPPKDAAPLEAEACAVPPPSSVCDGMPAGGVTYCIMIGIGTSYAQSSTPSSCRCTVDYTCGCILTDVPDPCAGHGKVADCMMFEGVPIVQCT